MKYDSMDEQNNKSDVYTNGNIDINQVINVGSNVKKKVARRRWAILAKALKSPTGSEPSSPTDEFSVRRISSFMLLTTQQIQNVIFYSQDKNVINQAKNRTWYKYSMFIENDELHVAVGHRIRTFSAEDLMGFNNTGRCDEICLKRVLDELLSVVNLSFPCPRLRCADDGQDDIAIWADYWKSQARKYCEFCKCWITDNKPSVEFHEKGRRHKENVAKRLKHITKKSRRDEQESLKVDAALAQMESAALEAYRKDVENNADLTSKSINKALQDNNLEIGPSGKVWREAVSESGKTYYWNILTNESAWEAPKEGYVKLSQQDENSKKIWKEYQTKTILSTRLRNEKDKKEQEEERAATAREKLKERRVEPIEPVACGPILESKTEPYGKWKVVNVQEIEEPQPTEAEIGEEGEEEAPVQHTVKEFKERTVESLSGGEKVQFKKRKFNQSARKNGRIRLDDD